MQNDKRSAGAAFAKNTAILTLGMICTQGLGFFLLPLYTAVLDTSEYGIYDILITYGTLLIPIVGSQYEQGLFRFMLDVRDDEEKQKELFSTLLAADVLHLVVFVAAMVCINLVIPVKNAKFLTLYVCLQVICAYLMQFVRGLGKSYAFAFSSFLNAGMTIVLNVILLAIIKMGLPGMFISVQVAACLAIIYLCAVIRPWNYFSLKKINKSTLREVRTYSLSMIPNNLSWWIINVSDRTIIKHFLGYGMTGIYTVANKFSNVFITLYNAINLSWTETVSLYYDNEDRDSFLSEMITRIYGIFAALCLGITACMPFLYPILINVRYQEGYDQVLILMYAMLLRVVVGLYSCIYVAQKDSKKIATTSGMAAAINVVVNLLLIGKIGIFAGSVSTFVAFGAMVIIRYRDINKTMSVHIGKRILVSSVVMAVLLTFTYYYNSMPVHIIALAAVTIYAFYINWPLLFRAKDFIRARLGKGSGNG